MSSKIKKIIALIVAVLLVIPATTAFGGCSKKNKEFTVTFDAGTKAGIARLAEGQDESILIQTVTDASDLIEPVFICEGAYHHGWNKVLKDIKTDTKVSALWYDSNFTVKLNPNAQDVVLCSDANCEYCKAEQVVDSFLSLKLPKHWSRTGYTIDWSGIEQIKVPTGKNPSVTIDAKWIPNNYTISFVDSDGVTKVAESISVKYDSEIGQLPELEEKEDLIFAGWKLKDTSTLIFSSSIFNYTDNIVLCAVWLEPEEYLITYQDVGEVNNPNAYRTSDENLYLNNPVKKGYEFTGWTGDLVEKDATGYYIPSGASGDLVLTANWKAKTFNIQFDCIGGTCSVKTKQFTYGKAVGDLPTATKEGYKFVGWMINSMNIDNDFIWNIDDASIQIVAKYLRYYTVEYHLNYLLYEGTKYETLVPSKILNETSVLANGFKKSETKDGVYYKESVLEGTILDADDFFSYEPLDKEEYYASKYWKARKFDDKKSKFVRYNVIPGMIVNEQVFPGTYESGVITFYASVGAYWTPGYV